MARHTGSLTSYLRVVIVIPTGQKVELGGRTDIGERLGQRAPIQRRQSALAIKSSKGAGSRNRRDIYLAA